MSNDKHLKDLSILLVDDDTDCREFLTICLEEQGASVTQAGDAETAVEILSNGQFDAIATDKNLPGMDGLELLGLIKENHGDLPVILITGFGSVGSAVDALKLGAQDYLTKPLTDADRLVTAILKAVDHHRLTLKHLDLQQRLSRAEKMETIGTLAGGVAHELNNILSPMVTLPDIIAMQIEETRQDGKGDYDSILEFLQLIKSSGRTAAAVVSDLLTSSTQGNYQKTPEDINQLIQECLESQEVSEVIRGLGNILIETNLDSGSKKIICSKFHITRVLTNLIRNGVEAIADAALQEQKLTVTTSVKKLTAPLMAYEVVPPGEYVLLKVSDTGAGISPEQMGKIFEPFYTSKKRTTHSGSGLGLSVVHGVIKDHGGFIDVSSERGAGTTFRVYLPTTEAAAVPAQIRTATRGGTESILVIDDAPVQRVLAEKILTKLGYTVTTSNNGREAVKLFDTAKAAGKDSPFDLIVLDMIMEEDFDGLSTYEAISELYPDPKTLIITAYADTERVETLLEIGAGLISKPYETRDLAKAVRNKIDGK